MSLIIHCFREATWIKFGSVRHTMMSTHILLKYIRCSGVIIVYPASCGSRNPSSVGHQPKSSVIVRGAGPLKIPSARLVAGTDLGGFHKVWWIMFDWKYCVQTIGRTWTESGGIQFWLEDFREIQRWTWKVTRGL